MRAIREQISRSILAMMVVMGCDQQEDDVPVVGANPLPRFPSCPVELASGDGFSCALLGDGGLRCWGDPPDGTFGDISQNGVFVPRLTEPEATGSGGNGPGGNGSSERERRQGELEFIAAGDSHLCALDADRRVWCWGGNSRGQLGPDGREAVSSEEAPAEVPFGGSDDRPVRITASGDVTCALGGQSNVWCWGTTPSGRDLAASRPVVSGSESQIVSISIDVDALVWVDLAGRVFRRNWGTAEIEGPGNLLGTVTRRVAGDCELKGSGTLWCAGQWIEGLRLPQPTAVQSSSLEAEGQQVCAVDEQGSVYCRLPVGANAPRSGQAHSFQRIDVPETIVVSTGKTHGCSVSVDGGIWCWGALAGRELDDPAELAACEGIPSNRYRGIETRLPTAEEVVEALAAEEQKECRCEGRECADRPTSPDAECLDALLGTSAAVLSCLAEESWRRALSGCEPTPAQAECEAPPDWLSCAGGERQ